MSIICCSLVALTLFALPIAAQVSFLATTYPAPSNTSPNVSIAADIDGDGNPDIITADGANPQLLIWYGTGGGKFGSPEFVGNLDGTGTDLAVGDFNGDGKLDILVATGQNHAVDLFLNDGSRTFSKQTVSTPDWPTYLAVADFNNDGKLDFAVSSYQLSTGTYYIQIYLGNGNGTFTPLPQQLPLPQLSFNIFARDLNQDGKIDLLSVGAPAFVFLNTGNAIFTQAQSLPVPGGGTYVYAGIGDLNGDAVPDLFLTNNQFCGEGCGWIKSLDSWLNDGTGHFTLKQSLQPTGSSDYSGVLADLNYDGKLDMVFESDGVLEYALGNGNGTFGTVQQAGNLNGPYIEFNPLLAHDLNNDGLMDIVSTATDSILAELNTSVKPDCIPSNSASLRSTVCSPVSGQTVNLTFSVRAAANGPVDLLRIEEWIDGKKLYQNLSNQVRNNLTLSAGTHTLSIVSVDVLGNIEKNKFAITVNDCTAPHNPGVRICVPTSGATVSSPVSVVATASPASGTYITAMRLYVDNVAKYTESGNSLSASVAVAAGSHYIVVVGYEAIGGAQKSTGTITVR